MRGKISLQRSDKLAVLFVDRAPAPEMIIVFGNLKQTFMGNITAPCHVLEKGDVRLYAADAEFAQGAVHALHGD